MYTNVDYYDNNTINQKYLGMKDLLELKYHFLSY